MRHVLAAGAPWGGGGSTQHSELHSRQQLKAFVMDVPDRHMLLICEGIQKIIVDRSLHAAYLAQAIHYGWANKSVWTAET